MFNLTVRCPLCGVKKTIAVIPEYYAAWKNNEMRLKDATPNLTEDERHFLMTGICGFCWADLRNSINKEEEFKNE